MKKKIIAIIVITFIMLSGCKSSANSSANEENNKNSKILWGTFVVVEERGDFSNGNLIIVYDKDTKVMYYIERELYSTTISPIYNTDGTVMIYNDMEEESN